MIVSEFKELYEFLIECLFTERVRENRKAFENGNVTSIFAIAWVLNRIQQDILIHNLLHSTSVE